MAASHNYEYNYFSQDATAFTSRILSGKTYLMGLFHSEILTPVETLYLRKNGHRLFKLSFGVRMGMGEGRKTISNETAHFISSKILLPCTFAKFSTGAGTWFLNEIANVYYTCTLCWYYLPKVHYLQKRTGTEANRRTCQPHTCSQVHTWCNQLHICSLHLKINVINFSIVISNSARLNHAE